MNAWEAKENKSVLKSDISTRDVINSINWLLFDVSQKSHFALHDHCSPFNARSIIRKKTHENIVESMMINDHKFSASFKCKLAFCSNALISNNNDWQCHVVFCFRFDFDFRCTVTNDFFFFNLKQKRSFLRNDG